jgi:hypothetical protein
LLPRIYSFAPGKEVIAAWKPLFGDKLRSREFYRQAVEAFVRCRAMNRMTLLGMPDSYRVQ